MTKDQRDDIARRLAATTPAPQQTDSFFDGLGLLASQSVESPGTDTRHGFKALRWSAVAASTVVLLSSAAYAGALGSPAKDGARQVIGQGTSASQGASDEDPVEQIAPVFVLEPRPAVLDDDTAGTDSADDSTDSADDSTDTAGTGSADDSTDSADDSTDSADDSTDSADDSTDSTDSTDSADDSTDSADDESSGSSSQGGDSSGHGSGDEDGGSSGTDD